MGAIIREVTIGPCRLIQGDCLEVLPDIGRVDAVVTDPPYGEKTHSGMRNGYGENSIDFASTSVESVRRVMSLCVPRRWLVTFIEWRFCGDLERAPPARMRFVRMGVWVKTNPMPQLTGDRPGTGWEAIAILHGDGRLRWNGGGKPAVYSHGKSRYGYFGPSLHPTEKPLGLVQEIVEDFTDFDETILDPFMGSGTTGVACIKTGRQFIGIEKEPKYFDIAVNRIRRAWQDKCSEIKFDEPEPMRQLLLTDATTEPPQ